MSQSKSASIMDASILWPAIGGAFKKLNPRTLIKNPVMFVVAVVSALTTVLFVRDLITGGGDFKFTLQIIIWLLVYGPPHLPSASDRSVPANISDTGANK